MIRYLIPDMTIKDAMSLTMEVCRKDHFVGAYDGITCIIVKDDDAHAITGLDGLGYIGEPYAEPEEIQL